MCVRVCVCPTNACCSALLCWPGHVATLKLLSESPVKLLRSSSTLAVGSGNPFASCSLHPPPSSLPCSLLHFPHPLSCFLSLRLRLSCFCLHLFVNSFPSPVLSPLCVLGSDRRICIIYVVKHHRGPSVPAGSGPAAHVLWCIPARITGNAVWQQPQSHMWPRWLFRGEKNANFKQNKCMCCT